MGKELRTRAPSQPVAPSEPKKLSEREELLSAQTPRSEPTAESYGHSSGCLRYRANAPRLSNSWRIRLPRNAPSGPWPELSFIQTQRRNAQRRAQKEFQFLNRESVGYIDPENGPSSERFPGLGPGGTAARGPLLRPPPAGSGPLHDEPGILTKHIRPNGIPRPYPPRSTNAI